jgi:hypothetical protein
MKQTTEFLTSPIVLRTTKQIFHKDFTQELADACAAEVAAGTSPASLSHRVNPVTFDAERFHGTECEHAAATMRQEAHPAWYKAYQTEHIDEFQDPQVSCRQAADVRPKSSLLSVNTALHQWKMFRLVRTRSGAESSCMLERV